MTAPAVKRHPVLAALCVLGLAISGCSAGTGAETLSATNTTTEAAKPKPPVIEGLDGSKQHNPSDPVTIHAPEGDLTKVTMTNEEGREVKGAFNADKTSWTTQEVLGYNRVYTIVAKASNDAKLSTTYETVKPEETTDVALSPLPNSTVGVGQPISFIFGRTIPDREAAEKAITITTEPHVDGAFFWLNPRLVRWRPENYWKPGTKVTVKVKMHGTDLGKGVWGGNDNETSFTIGDQVIATADNNTKQITITKNGEVIRTMPTSMGRPGFDTPNGIYTIGDQYPSLVMDSSTFGLPVNSPNGYRTNVQWATQMSWSGIYVHSAPWSVWAQGSTNTSHGCLNVSPANAEWFQQFTKRGDIVVVKNTAGGQLNGFDGLGDWNIPWSVWKKGNTHGDVYAPLQNAGAGESSTPKPAVQSQSPAAATTSSVASSSEKTAATTASSSASTSTAATTGTSATATSAQTGSTASSDKPSATSSTSSVTTTKSSSASASGTSSKKTTASSTTTSSSSKLSATATTSSTQ